MVAQATALPRLCSQLRLAKGLRELVLDLDGGAAYAVPAEVATLSCLTQLDSLQLHSLAIHHVTGDHLTAALSSLTQLTQLSLRFECEPATIPDAADRARRRLVFPWTEAVCGLTKLQQLCIAADASGWSSNAMYKGTLPAALSQLTALQHITVLGMETWQGYEYSVLLPLAALPALDNAALRMRSASGDEDQQPVVLPRLVSLSFALQECVSGDEQWGGTHLPTLIAPALTELVLEDMWLDADSGQLSWMAGLPHLRRLVLKSLQIFQTASGFPEGVTACSSLTELVVEHITVSPRSQPDSDRADVWSDSEMLQRLPVADTYVGQLVRLSLARNAFSSVPPILAAATAMQLLDLAHQHVYVYGDDPDDDDDDLFTNQRPARLHGLSVLNKLPCLRGVDLAGFDESDAGIREFRAAHPDVRLTF